MLFQSAFSVPLNSMPYNGMWLSIAILGGLTFSPLSGLAASSVLVLIVVLRTNQELGALSLRPMIDLIGEMFSRWGDGAL